MSLSTFEFFLKKSQNIAIFCDKLRFFEIFCDFLQKFAKICNKLQKSSNLFEVCLFMVSSWNYLKLFELFWQFLRSLMWKCITSYFCPMDYVVEFIAFMRAQSECHISSDKDSETQPPLPQWTIISSKYALSTIDCLRAKAQAQWGP